MALQLSSGSTTAAAGQECFTDGWTTTAGQELISDGLTTSAGQDILTNGWTTTAGLYSDGSTKEGLFTASAGQDIFTAIEQELFTQEWTANATDISDQVGLDESPLDLSGLSDFLKELLEPNSEPKKCGCSLSKQLRDEPGLFEALTDLGFKEEAEGKSCNNVHSCS